MQFHSQTCGIAMGGANMRAEQDKLTKGVSLLVATPGRLLDHLMVRLLFTISVGTDPVAEHQRLYIPCARTFFSDIMVLTHIQGI
jgi:hypothetical protein